MGAKICQEEQLDKELDPQVIARRHELYNKYVAPFYNMIYKLCIQYSFNSRNVQENYNEVLVNFYRRIETYDPERSIRTWLHIVTKRHILALERKRQAEIDKDNDDNKEETLYEMKHKTFDDINICKSRNEIEVSVNVNCDEDICVELIRKKLLGVKRGRE